MDILPIDKVRDEDAPIVGADLVNLSRLAHLKFPVAKGLVVTPPEFKIKTLLQYFNLRDKEIFEQSLTVIKKEIAKIPPPESLEESLRAHKLDPGKIWQDLLGLWLEEIRKRVWNSGLSKGVTLGLSAHSVFFIKKIYSQGKAFLDPGNNQVIIEVSSGVMDVEARVELDKIVREGNKKLIFPQNYFWVIDNEEGKVKLVRLTPFTHYSESKKEYSIFDGLKAKESEAPEVKSAVKVFLKSPKSHVLHPGVDGVLISGEEVGNLEEKIFKIVETASAVMPNPLIYKLSDIKEQPGGVRGALRLNHQESLLKEDTEALLFARNKKGLINVVVCVPFIRSVNEFLQIKRNLSSLGVSRKGSLKLWLELSVPENFLNLEEYLLAGLDGVIVNLDELSGWLGGFDHSIPESIFYKKQINALVKFVEDPLKLLHKSKVSFLATGSLALHDEILEFLIDKGVYAVVADLANAQSLSDHLRFVEKRVIRARA